MLSMTGYGRGRAGADGREITVELKAVNHRFLDLSFRTPRTLLFLEDPMREMLRTARRGHLDVTVSYINTREDAHKIQLDGTLLASFRQAAADQPALAGLSQLTAADLISLSGALSVAQTDEDQDSILALTRMAMADAMSMLENARAREGEHLSGDLLANLDQLEACLGVIRERAPQVPLLYRARLESRLQEWQIDSVEPQRIAQEVAILADHCAIDEEISRLTGHITQFRRIVADEIETGRRLDFLIQEMNREVNTMASKASDDLIIGQAVQGKCVIEKLREQVQNAL